VEICSLFFLLRNEGMMVVLIFSFLFIQSHAVLCSYLLSICDYEDDKRVKMMRLLSPSRDYLLHLCVHLKFVYRLQDWLHFFTDSVFR
jgi:hypothetical protein